MHCASCGEYITKQHKFCPHCGLKNSPKNELSGRHADMQDVTDVLVKLMRGKNNVSKEQDFFRKKSLIGRDGCIVVMAFVVLCFGGCIIMRMNIRNNEHNRSSDLPQKTLPHDNRLSNLLHETSTLLNGTIWDWKKASYHAKVAAAEIWIQNKNTYFSIHGTRISIKNEARKFVSDLDDIIRTGKDPDSFPLIDAASLILVLKEYDNR